MLDLPIFIVQVHASQVAPETMQIFADRSGDHANEFETSLLLHLTPHLVAPLSTAGDGAQTPSKLPAVSKTPGVWAPRDWPSLTRDTGAGDPRAATAEKGRQMFEAIVTAIVPVLTQLSAAQNGDFPYVVRDTRR
jgi:creatinine amidohydrolase